MTQRCGFVAILGAPNAGKSTLLNRLLGAKLAIVTPKPQTTRRRMLGIVIEGETQIVLVDTPGIFAPRRRFDRAMVGAAWTGAADADQVMVLIDAERGIDGDAQRVLDGLAEHRPPAIAVLNKIDLVDKNALLPLAERLDKTGLFQRVMMISSLNGDGVADLKQHLAAAMPEGPWHYPEDQLTDLSERLIAAEITRERLFLELRQELPYASAVETDRWQDQKDGSVRLDQTIHVERATQKAIVVGKGGQQIKRIGELARAEMERSFGRRVHLFLFVRVTEGWSDRREYYDSFGLDYES
ncbi:MAG TPA: GTPase Era [Stellaceae bacterium]|jgi:GTP-binding protein Era|nr:GTPase Era [Stellaceae bacterium]